MTANNAPLFLEDLAPWNENPNSIWLASTILLNRNIENYNFPAKLPVEKKAVGFSCWQADCSFTGI